MILLAGRGRRGVDEVLQRAAAAEVTYPEQGGTRLEVLPHGYRHDRRVLDLGRGAMTWDRACEAIEHWEAHRHAGFTITPALAPIEGGQTLLASRSIGGLVLVIPCRIIYRTDEPGRFGFAYGTLPGHPERGEEAFHIVRTPDGSVLAEIVAFSRPADLPTRLAGPIARSIQKAATRQYLAGINRYVRAGA
jgi:uncharacterized protein (UPF0548 family)